MNIAACALCNRNQEGTAVVFAHEDSPDKVHRVSLKRLRQDSMQVATALQASSLSPGNVSFPGIAIWTGRIRLHSCRTGQSRISSESRML